MSKREGENVGYPNELDTVRAAPSTEAAVSTLRRVYKFDHVTHHLAKKIIAHVEEPYVKTTYPAEWIKRYLLEKRYMMIDPVVREGFSRRFPFHWDELELTPEMQELFEAARKHGIGVQGYTIPIVDREGRRSILSVTSSMQNAEWRAFTRKITADLAEAGHVIHRMSIREIYGEDHNFPHLSHREIECLSWTAQGKDAPTIAMILHLSDHTVRAYLRSVRYKLDCSTLSQAVAKAIQFRIITP